MCDCCNNSLWLGQDIPLEIHHEDGDSSNNELVNLRLLCPNCHALTDNYRGRKNIKRNYVSDEAILEVIPNCISINEVLLSLNMAISGYSYERVRNLLRVSKVSLKNKD